MRSLILLFVLSLVTLITGCAPESPEEKAFDAASRKIMIYEESEGVAFGNTAEAVELAGAFSEELATLEEEMFTGGRDSHALTSGQFLTFCQLTPNKVIFLCTVPGLKDYKDDVREALAELAWSVGQDVTADLPAETELVVALKGSFLFGPVWSGTTVDDATSKDKGQSALKPHYPAFLE